MSFSAVSAVRRLFAGIVSLSGFSGVAKSSWTANLQWFRPRMQ
jgi:hypothetical protein